MKSALIYLLASFVLFSACNNGKNQRKQNQTSEGVQVKDSNKNRNTAGKTFNQSIELSDSLKAQGLELGKVHIKSSDSAATNHVLSAYFIFHQNFSDTLRATVTDREGLEYGRLYKPVQRKANEAGFIEFVFSSKTNIQAKSQIKIE